MSLNQTEKKVLNVLSLKSLDQIFLTLFIVKMQVHKSKNSAS